MNTLRTLGTSLALSSLTLFSAAHVFAQECETDTDCKEGYTCQVTGGSASGCAAPVCAEGEVCDPVDCEPTVTEYRSCEPAPCKADSDCADGLICETLLLSGDCTATDVACAPDEDCALPAPTCGPSTEYSRCVEPYNTACSESADCGKGFNCVKYEECDCASSGGVMDAPANGSAGEAGAGNTSAGGVGTGGTASGGSPTSDNADLLPPPNDPPECTCRESATGYCQVEEMPCEVDDQCPTDWSCVPSYESTCSSTGQAGTTSTGAVSSTGTDGATGGAAAADSGGGERLAPVPDPGPEAGGSGPDCVVETGPSFCVPPNYFGGGTVDVAFEDGSVGEATSTGAGGSGAGPRGTGDGDESAPAPGAGASVAGDHDAKPTPDTSSKGDVAHSAVDDTSADEGGCSVSAAGKTQGSPVWLLGLLGLGLGLVRRQAARR